MLNFYYRYGVARDNANLLETTIKNAYPDDKCEAFMRHKNILASPQFLKNNQIPFFRTLQKYNEIIITLPRGYHQVVNIQKNLALAANFGTIDWVPHGVCASRCKCPHKL
jgi:jumonji domain-containing protein 2